MRMREKLTDIRLDMLMAAASSGAVDDEHENRPQSTTNKGTSATAVCSLSDLIQNTVPYFRVLRAAAEHHHAIVGGASPGGLRSTQLARPAVPGPIFSELTDWKIACLQTEAAGSARIGVESSGRGGSGGRAPAADAVGPGTAVDGDEIEDDD